MNNSTGQLDCANWHRIIEVPDAPQSAGIHRLGIYGARFIRNHHAKTLSVPLPISLQTMPIGDCISCESKQVGLQPRIRRPP